MTNLEFNSRLLGMQSKLHRFAMSLTSDRETAPDLVQDTYLKALIYKDQFVEFTNFKNWIFTIMKNTYINNYRRNVKKNTIIDGNQDLNNIYQVNDKGSISPESVFSAQEIEITINSMSDEFRIPFRMHVAGYKYKEIASELGLKLGTVKGRIFIARKKLMSQLNDYKS
jgi:RNA polymerase sigma factor (sigma-70 family)